MNDKIKKVWFFDLEQFPNFHSGTFKSLDGEVRVYKLFEDGNEIYYYKNFLKSEVSGVIGYNNNSYDYPMLHFILTYEGFEFLCNNEINKLLYQKSQDIINSEFSSIKLNEVLIPQLDLYKIWHFDNRAKATSLKSVEAAIRFHNVEDLPFPFDYTVKEEDVQKILDYNLNDVDATEVFYNITIGKIDGLYKGDDKIQLRKDIQKEFEINCINYNDGKIGEELAKKFYLKLSGRSWYDVKNSSTERKWINIRDLIPSYIEFKSPILQAFLEEIRDKSFMTHEKFKRKIEFADCIFEFAKGGLHSVDKPGVFKPKEDQILADYDVSSLYPATMINLGIYPAHLGPEFLTIYKELFDKRLKAKKEKNKVVSDALKLSLNIVYGKLGAKNSWLKDELAMFKVTFAGQLSLLMLIEAYHLNGIKVISANTDGIVTLYSKDQVELIDSINQKWQLICNYQLEQTLYKKYVRRDVNSYITQKTDGKIKYKGIFEPQREIHKNHSETIISLALKAYFIDEIAVEETINNCKDIFDFCSIVKKKGDIKFETWTYDKFGNKEIQKLGKVVRYYTSNTGSTLMKILPPLTKQTITKTEIHKQKVDSSQMNIFNFVEDVKVIKNRENNVQKGQLITIFNRFEFKNFEDYNVNLQWFIDETNKIIKLIEK